MWWKCKDCGLMMDSTVQIHKQNCKHAVKCEICGEIMDSTALIYIPKCKYSFITRKATNPTTRPQKPLLLTVAEYKHLANVDAPTAKFYLDECDAYDNYIEENDIAEVYTNPLIDYVD